MRKKVKEFNLNTFSKKWVSRLMFFSILDLQLSYILAFFGREQIAETLSCAIIAEIIGIMLPYFIKSFFETKEEKRLEFEKEQYNDQKLLNDCGEFFIEEDEKGECVG